MDRKDYKKEFKKSLLDIIDNLDDYYYNIKNQIEEEVLERKEKIAKITKETNNIYNILNDDMCVKLVSTTLPFRVKFINKISYRGRGIISNELIYIHYTLNNNNRNLYCVFNIDEIKEILKL